MHIHILLVHKTFIDLSGSRTDHELLFSNSFFSIHFSACFGKDPGEGGLLADRGHLAGEEGPREE